MFSQAHDLHLKKLLRLGKRHLVIADHFSAYQKKVMKLREMLGIHITLSVNKKIY